MARWYIGGCNVAFKLSNEFDIEGLHACHWREDVAGARRGTMPALAKALTHQQALEICRKCPHATVQPYLEQAPERESDRAAEVEQRRPPAEPPWVPEAPPEAPTPTVADLWGGYGPEPELESEPKPEPEPAPTAPEPYSAEIAPEDFIPFDPTKHDAWDGGGKGGTPMRVPPEAAKAPPSGAPAVLRSGGPRPTIDQLLPGVTGGPSIFGQSAVRVARTCLRMFFWKFIAGLFVPFDPGPQTTAATGKVKLSPLEVGIGVHACAEVYYKTLFDAVASLNALEQLKAVYPLLAVEITRLWNFYLAGFHKTDSQTWDIRGVELETRFFYPKRKCRGAQRSLCISARHDTIVREVGAGDRRLPLEERSPEGVYIHDLKTIAQISDAAVRAWRHEAQGLQNLLCWSEGFAMAPADPERGLPRRVGTKPAVERYGAANGLIITHIGKAIEQDPAKHLRRTKFVIPERLIAGYRDETGDFLYEQVFDRLFHKDDVRRAPETWPRSFLACRDPMTNRACEYLALCEGGGPHGAADPEKLGFKRGRELRGADLLQPKKKSGKGKKRKGTAELEDK